MLYTEKIEVTPFDTGEEALIYLQFRHIDLIMAEIILPDQWADVAPDKYSCDVIVPGEPAQRKPLLNLTQLLAAIRILLLTCHLLELCQKVVNKILEKKFKRNLPLSVSSNNQHKKYALLSVVKHQPIP